MLKISCSPEPLAIDSLTPDEMRHFGILVNRLRKSGYDQKKAQEMAYQRVLLESLADVEKEV